MYIYIIVTFITLHIQIFHGKETLHHKINRGRLFTQSEMVSKTSIRPNARLVDFINRYNSLLNLRGSQPMGFAVELIKGY